MKKESENSNRNKGIKGAWIFVSHSGKDLKEVRRIRNELEALGANPILFFLKCLDEKDSRLPQLIHDEIKSRNWFMLCDSPNAKDSRWVQDEIEIIKSMQGKVYEVVSLEDSHDVQRKKIKSLVKRTTIFLSYANADKNVAERIARRLNEEDYNVFLDFDSLNPGKDWSTTITSAIDEAVKDGFVLLLLSPESLTSKWCANDFKYALVCSGGRSLFRQRSSAEG